MKKPQVNFLILIVLSFFCLNSCNAPSKPQDEWISLFNGVDMQGWTVKIKGYDAGDNFGNTFRVEDSLLKVRYDAYENFDNRFGHIYYKDTFSHYIIRLQYRFVGDQCPGAPGWAIRNSGIMVHGQTVETIEKDQDFPVSIEVQLLGGDGVSERTTGNLCTPGTNVVMDGELRLVHCTSSTSKTYHGDQWVTAEVEVHGGQTIKHIINGDTVLVYSEPQLDERDPSFAKLLPADGNKILTRGTISLQSEGHPVEFRKVELKILEK